MGDEDSDEVEDEFRTGGEHAAHKFGVKRRRKYLFNEEGIPIEPFNMAKDENGNMLLDREKNYEDEEDPWLLSIKQEQDERRKKECMQAADSDESEHLSSQGTPVDEDND